VVVDGPSALPGEDKGVRAQMVVEVIRRRSGAMFESLPARHLPDNGLAW
jgi:hypothetical protein